MSDIRNYFSKGQTRSHQPKQTVSKRRVIQDSEDDEEVVQEKKVQRTDGHDKSEGQTDPQTFFEGVKIEKVPVKVNRPTKRKLEKEVEVEEEEEEAYGAINLDDQDFQEIDQQSQTHLASSKASKEVNEPISDRGEMRTTVSPITVAKKRKASTEDSSVDNDLEPQSGSTHKKLKSQITSPRKTLSKAKAGKDTKPGAPDAVKTTNSILDSIPLVEVPEAGAPVAFRYGQAAPSATAPGSKIVPEGADGCLFGLNFVFTGVLESLDRVEAQDLVKKYGGKVMTAPSRNTSYVVLGDQAGPKKIEKIKSLGVKVIDEDGLLKMIAIMPAQGGGSSAAQKVVEKRDAEQRKAKELASNMRKEEIQLAQQNELKVKQAEKSGQKIKLITPADQLWTTKYAPVSLKDVVGNKSNVEKLSRFLVDWPKNLKAKFKKGGPDGLGLYRAVLLSGSPGIGKTTSAHLAAQLAGYDVLEFNASDTRSKRLLEDGLKGVVNNTSLLGYFGAEGTQVDTAKKQLVLIMDEVDGMSAGDRGGVGALNAVIRKTTIPIICICNDRSSQKLRPLDKTTFDLKYSKPTKDQVRSRIMSIAYREGLNISPQAVDQLVDGTGSDIRQIINLLSTYRLTGSRMDQDQGKTGAKEAEKHVILKPWDIVGKFLNGAMYHERSKSTLNEKIELYFNDHDMSYLMVQENYLNTTPDKARSASSAKEKTSMGLRLAAKAASAISDGDMVDAMIHGSQQHWSLMPVHAVFSCVRPCSFVAGAGGRYNFTSVLGNMSKFNKASRLIREIRAHLRLKTSGDRQDIRKDYVPALFERLPRALGIHGPENIPTIIDLMDEYYLSKEDYESLLELGIGPNDKSTLEGIITSATKAAFTRQYNKASHPTAFMTQTTGPPPKKLQAGDLPDFEDAVELSDEDIAVEKEEESASEDDELSNLKKDKLIQAPKKTKRNPASSKSKKQAKK